jgi:Thermolysin metallopeptidase, alpha-helical domain
MTASCARHCIVPPGLLYRLARSDDETLRHAALHALALDEHFRLLARSPRRDVFGIQVKQYALGQDVHSSNWLIGADIVGPALRPALRSMKQPGTANAYDDQPADMNGYVSGGDVHRNPEPRLLRRGQHARRSCVGGGGTDLVRRAGRSTASAQRHIP